MGNVLHPAAIQSLLLSPRDQCWGQSCSISLLMIWTWGPSTPSVSSWTTLKLGGVLIFRRVGMLCRRIWTGWIDGLRPIVWSSIRLSAGSCTGVTTTPCYGLGEEKWPTGKITWGAGQHWLGMNQHPRLFWPRWSRRPMASWFVSKIHTQCVQQDQGSTSCTQHWWAHISNCVVSSGPLTRRKTLNILNILNNRRKTLDICPEKGKAGKGSRG